jgi:hypothetical protein
MSRCGSDSVMARARLRAFLGRHAPQVLRVQRIGLDSPVITLSRNLGDQFVQVNGSLVVTVWWLEAREEEPGSAAVSTWSTTSPSVTTKSG